MDVLLVEDNDGDAELVREALAGAGIALTTEHRLDLASKRLERERFDVVLLDLALPDARELEALTALHALAPDAPIVVFTNLHDAAAGARALQYGAQDYLQKGVEGSEIRRAVRYAFERAQYAGRARLLGEVGAALGSSLESDEIIRALDHVVTRGYADSCSVAQGAATPPDSAPRSSAGRATLHRSGAALDVAGASSLGSAIIAPFHVVGWPDGALTLGRRTGAAPFSEADLPLAEELARRLGSALVHAGLVKIADRDRERAESASRVHDEFLAVLSHELRSPLNAILGWTQLLRAGQVTAAKQPHALETIERNARSQLTLIEDVIDVSRISTGRLRMQMQVVDAAVVLQRAIEAVRPAAQAKSVALHVEASPTPLRGDPDRLLQVCWNLLNNAVKFTPRGGHVTATVHRVDSMAEMVVRDSGSGIAPAFVPHVFERFRQADASSARVHAGLGLGLTITRHLVEAHGGTIRAESAGLGHGSTFFVRVPILLLAAAEQPSSPRVGPDSGEVLAPLTTLPTLGGISILIVEDDQDSREMLQVVLEQNGAVVEAVSSVAEAFAALEREAPDIVISDIGMPGATGYDFITTLRKRPTELSTLPAIALSAYAGVDDRANALMHGFDQYLTKPVEPRELIATVGNLDRRFGRRLA